MNLAYNVRKNLFSVLAEKVFGLETLLPHITILTASTMTEGPILTLEAFVSCGTYSRHKISAPNTVHNTGKRLLI